MNKVYVPPPDYIEGKVRGWNRELTQEELIALTEDNYTHEKPENHDDQSREDTKTESDSQRDT